MTHTDYKIITVSKEKGEDAAADLTMKVQALLNENAGWELQGGVTVSSYQHVTTPAAGLQPAATRTPPVTVTRMAQALSRSKIKK